MLCHLLKEQYRTKKRIQFIIIMYYIIRGLFIRGLFIRELVYSRFIYKIGIKGQISSFLSFSLLFSLFAFILLCITTLS